MNSIASERIENANNVSFKIQEIEQITNLNGWYNYHKDIWSNDIEMSDGSIKILRVKFAQNSSKVVGYSLANN